MLIRLAKSFLSRLLMPAGHLYDIIRPVGQSHDKGNTAHEKTKQSSIVAIFYGITVQRV
jgi:hypothetical protein